MQDILNMFEGLAFLAEYSHLMLLALFALALLCFLLLLGISSSVRRQGMESAMLGQDLAKTVQEKDTGMMEKWEAHAHENTQANSHAKEVLDKVAQGTQKFQSEVQTLHASMEDLQRTVEGAHKTAGEKDSSLRTLLEEVRANAGKKDDTLHALLEKNSVFLYDRFNELSASEHSRLQELEKKLAALLSEQSKQVSGALQEVLARNSQGDTMQALRDGIAREIADLMLKERALQQEAQTQTLNLMSESINRLAGEMDAKLTLVTDKVSNRFNENLASTMQSFSTLQGQIDALLSAKEELGTLGSDVTSLTRLILSRSGGGITAGHLPELLSAMLPDDAYVLNPVVNGQRAAAQLMLPGEQGAVIIDSSLPLEEFDLTLAQDTDEATRSEARRAFGERVMAHINHVADCFISPPATGGSALLFVPSETAFAEIQAHYKDCTSHAASRQVWLVSPTTLAAALNMARSALKDQKARAQLEKMKKALQQVAHDAQAFEARLLEIGDHVNNAMRSVQRAENAGVKLFGDVHSIAAAAEDNAPPPALTQADPPAA